MNIIQRIRKLIGRNSANSWMQAVDSFIRSMTTEEAEYYVSKYIEIRDIDRLSWQGGIPDNIRDLLDSCDPTVGRLFSEFKRIDYSESFTTYDAQYLLELPLESGTLTVARINDSGRHLVVLPKSPIVWVSEEAEPNKTAYPTIFHGMLIADLLMGADFVDEVKADRLARI